MPVGAVSTITGGRFFGRSNQKSASLIPNYVGGITIVQLGAEVRNDRGGQTSAYSVHTSVDKCIRVHTACIQKMRLSTLRNILIISEVHTKSAECRQFAI